MKAKKMQNVALVGTLLLGLVPWPESVMSWIPFWGLLLVITWLYLDSTSLKLQTVFFFGLLVDIFSGGVLGVHALGYVIVYFLFYQVRFQFKFYPTWQQAGLVFIFSLLHATLLFGVQSLFVYPPVTWNLWGSLLTTTVLWMVIGTVLNHTYGHLANIRKIHS